MSRVSDGLVSDALIDRLVDGELEESERRTLLEQLDAQPEGWRRCALAFLEAQAWTRAFHSTAEPAVISRSSVPTPGPGTSADDSRPWGGPHPTRDRLRSVGPLAAGVILAFAVGWFTGTASQRSTSTPTDLVVEGRSQSASPRTPPASSSRSDDPEARVQNDLEPRRIPVAQSVLTGSPWTAVSAPVLPDQVRRQLERQGYRVEQRSGLVPLELSDGQRFGVPVDEVELRYVGDRTY